MKVVIIGGGAAGASAASRLRRLDEQAEIILLDMGGFISHSRAGLPHSLGFAEPEPEALARWNPDEFARLYAVDVGTFRRVAAIDRAKKIVTAYGPAPDNITEIHYDKLILAPGSLPVNTPYSGCEDERVLCVADIPTARRVRDLVKSEAVRSVLIAGGGFLAIETAENLMRAGCSVTLAVPAGHLPAQLDFDVAAELYAHLREKGLRLILEQDIKLILSYPSMLEAELSGGIRIRAGLVLLCADSRACGDLAAGCGLDTDRNGFILTDSHLHTSDPHILAAGSAVRVRGRPLPVPDGCRRHGSSRLLGRIAADNIHGIPSTVPATSGTAILKCFDMTAARVGIGEQEAAALGIAFEKSYTWSPSRAEYYPGARGIALKLIFERESGKLLGAQLAGFDGVDKRCDILSAAIRSGMTVESLATLELACTPPFSPDPDPVNTAGLVAENIRRGLVGTVHWHDVTALRDSGTVWLDVRSQDEIDATGPIAENAVHIPLDYLRGRLDELQLSDGPVCVYCHSGRLGYHACRILTRLGIACRNLSGGWRLYSLCADAMKEPVHSNGDESVSSGADSRAEQLRSIIP